MSKNVKLAVIRGKNVSKCPYSLDITTACHDVGNTILTMQALELVDENEVKKAADTNKTIYLTQKTGERCPFANEIMDKFDAVDCSWGDTAAGEGTHYLTPSPLYPRTFIGDNINPSPRDDGRGINVTDPRYYFDEPQRGIGVPFGLFSIFSDTTNEANLLKLAAKPTNNADSIGAKLAILRNKYFDALKLVIPDNKVVKLSEQQLEELLLIIDEWTQ